MKKLFALFVGLTAVFSLSATGMASADSATSDVKIVPQGQVFEKEFAPVDLSLGAEVFPATPPSTNAFGLPAIKPIETITYNLTQDQKFVPDPNMPACTKINPDNANFPPNVAISMCPDSVVGNGAATLLLANALAGVYITDPKLTVFYAGTDNQGRAVVTIQGYSATTNAGIYMTGTLKSGELAIAVPRLTADSATTVLGVSIPGELGQTKDFVQSKCSTGKWDVNATLLLGFRDENDVSTQEETVNTPEQSIACKASVPKAKISKVTVKGPNKVKRGKKATFKTKIKNSGNAKATGVKLKISGKGVKLSSSVGKIGAKETKTVKSKFKATKQGKVKLKFKVTSKNAGGKTVKKNVTVK